MKGKKNAENQPTTNVLPPGQSSVVNIESIRPDPHQPRKTFDEVKLQELAEKASQATLTLPPKKAGETPELVKVKKHKKK